MQYQLIICDRDGVINHDTPDYIKSVDEWLPISGSCQAIAKLYKHGYKIAIATNQSGIGRGLYDEHTYRKIEQKMIDAIQQEGGACDYIAFCPHTPEDNCQCRKPKTGMLQDIFQRSGIASDQCLFVGDSLRDIQAAQAAGCTPVLVLTGNGQKTKEKIHTNGEGATIAMFTDLASFADYQVAQS